MILKVKSENPSARESWRFFDNIVNLHYSIYDDGRKFLAEKEQWPAVDGVQDLNFMYEREHPVAPLSSPMLFAAFQSAATGSAHLMCETECYLLNDAGKTIEKLI